MRLGINGDLGQKDPEDWIRIIKEHELRAAIMPVGRETPAEVRDEYLRLAKENDIVIGEVGVWNNVMDPDPVKSREAIRFAKEQLAYADEVGARCCVNVSGAAGSVWDGYYPENYSEDTYARIVDVTREIIDAVKPVRTFYTLEPMYWMLPDSPDNYVKLIHDVDRERFGAHMDYANMITSNERYHNCEEFIRYCFSVMGPYVKSVHAKDVVLRERPPVCIEEALPGTGRVDFSLVLTLADRLDKDMPVFAEHLHYMYEYEQAIDHMKDAWKKTGQK